MKRILVVEDDSTLAASMVQGLKAEPFEVELCVRGDIAYDKALAWDPDLIILDLNGTNVPLFTQINNLVICCQSYQHMIL